MKWTSVVTRAALAAALLAGVSTAARAGTTLENLQAAYNGESNAHARYVAFAQKADEEGYARVAALFRAAARAEEIHAANHAEVIRKMKAEPAADIQVSEVKTTAENLQTAIDGETYERDTMYPDFLKQARAEKDKKAVRTFTFAVDAEKDHAALYASALADLDNWKTAGDFYVCPVCGNTVSVVDFKKCDTCFTKASKFETVG